MTTSKPSSEITRLIKAFGYSMQGLKWGMMQPAFRVEVIGLAILLPCAFVFAQSAMQFVLLVGSLLLVLIVELLNSAIETAIDRISLERHELSGRAKDMGSAAVLLALVNAAIIWVAVLW